MKKCKVQNAKFGMGTKTDQAKLGTNMRRGRLPRKARKGWKKNNEGEDG
jgi:hypothetical protein